MGEGGDKRPPRCIRTQSFPMFFIFCIFNFAHPFIRIPDDVITCINIPELCPVEPYEDPWIEEHIETLIEHRCTGAQNSKS